MAVKIYVAASWVEKATAKFIKNRLEDKGYTVTSRWIEGYPESVTGMDKSPEMLRQEALNDVEDVQAADILVLYNSQKRGEETSGKAVETGIAIDRGIPVVMIGAWSNVFHFLPTVKVVGTIEEAIDYLEASK